MSADPFQDLRDKGDTRRQSSDIRPHTRRGPLLQLSTELRDGLVAPAVYYTRSDGEVREYVLRFETTHIGSSNDNHIVVDGARSNHAKVRLEQDRICIRDLQTGETYLNDVAIEEADIQPGDSLRLGKAHLSIAMKVLAPDAIAEPIWDARTALGLKEDEEGAAVLIPEKPGWGLGETLERLRIYTTTLDSSAAFDAFLGAAVSGLVTLLRAERVVCILFEEDGKNPIFSVERTRDESEDEDDGDDTQANVDEDLVAQAMKTDNVVVCDRPATPDDPFPRKVLAVRVRYLGHPVGLIYCERQETDSPEITRAAAELCAIAARILAHPLRQLLGTGPQD